MHLRASKSANGSQAMLMDTPKTHKAYSGGKRMRTENYRPNPSRSHACAQTLAQHWNATPRTKTRPPRITRKPAHLRYLFAMSSACERYAVCCDSGCAASSRDVFANDGNLNLFCGLARRSGSMACEGAAGML